MGQRLRRRSPVVDPVEVLPAAAGGLCLAPTGFAGSFNPSVHPALMAVQEAAIHAIFNLFGLKYIPGEYLVILARKPDPTDAWVEFCQEFGLHIGRLGDLERNEVNRLHQVVGLLIELSQLRPELEASGRERILEALKNHQHDVAEELIDIARSIITLVRNAATLGSFIVFPHYEGFIKNLRRLLANLGNATKDEAEKALRYEQGFRDFQSQFDAVIAHLDAEIGWMLNFWPNNDWGTTNAPVKDGIVAMKEGMEEQLKTDVNASIPNLLQELQLILDDLMTFIDEIKANHDGGAFDPLVDTSAEVAWKEWSDAALVFGFGETAEPIANEIKKIYRKLALECHPDRFTDPTEKAVATEKFKALGAAREVLDRYAASGKPKKPTTK
ncbi:MAG: J domain-containing protein [Candidatus Uhrbacteria bacterium]|nr:J domain-containing protein [Candidatus Uhrbacteria bacterium]